MEPPTPVPEPTPEETRAPAQWSQNPTSWWWIATAVAASLIIGIGLFEIILLFARPIALLILGISVGTAFSPLVKRLESRLPRALSVVFIYLVLALLVGGTGWIIVPQIVQQGQEIGAAIPGWAQLLQAWISQSGLVNLGTINSALSSQVGSFGVFLLDLPLRVAGWMVDFILVVAISLYWLLAAPALQAFTLSFFPEERRPEANHLLEKMGRTMGGYIRGTTIDGLIFAILVYIALILLGVKYPLVLSLVAFLFEFIPFIGPFLSGAFIVGVALTQSFTLAIISMVIMVVLQEFEGHVLVPNVMQTQTDLPPLLAVLALFAGDVVGGLIGALTAIPLAAALKVFIQEVIAPAIRRRTRAVGPHIEV